MEDPISSQSHASPNANQRPPHGMETMGNIVDRTKQRIHQLHAKEQLAQRSWANYELIRRDNLILQLRDEVRNKNRLMEIRQTFFHRREQELADIATRGMQSLVDKSNSQAREIVRLRQQFRLLQRKNHRNQQRVKWMKRMAQLRKRAQKIKRYPPSSLPLELVIKDVRSIPFMDIN